MGAPSKEIAVCAANPRYWQYGGEPVLLLGGSVEDNLFQVPDLAEHLDTLSAAGGNYVRCTMSSRDEGDVWPFARAGDLYDLDRWDEEYWRRFATFLEETAKRDVIVQVEVWATFDYYRDNWARNPFNPACNVNYSARESGLPEVVESHPIKTANDFFRSVPEALDLGIVASFQRHFVNRMLHYTLQFGHLLYCMDNETSVGPEWGAYWSRHIREAAEQAGRFVHVTEMWDPWDLDPPMHRATWEHPETYTFVDVSQNNHESGQVHYDNAQKMRARVADPVRPMNSVKIYGADGGRFGTTRDGVERFWRNIFGGLASARFHRPDSGIGLSDLAQRMIRAAREVTGAFDIFRCQPRPGLLADREENEAYCMAEMGWQCAVYFPEGGSVALDLAGAEGKLSLRWYDIDGAEWSGPESVVGGGVISLVCPADGQWAAVIT